VGGPWVEVSTVGADAEELGEAMLKAKAAQAYRVLEVVSAGHRE
jgi:hypothetical protein